jgi:hypothetical protein
LPRPHCAPETKQILTGKTKAKAVTQKPRSGYPVARGPCVKLITRPG